MSQEILVRSREDFEEINWSRARIVSFGQSFGEEAESGTFWGSLEGLEFRQLDQFVESALDANGFEANLENLLYALETLRLGRRARVQSGKAHLGVRQYQPVLCFDWPRRGRSGALLARLYGLIESVKEGTRSATSSGVAQQNSMRERLERETQRAETLQKETKRLSQALAEAQAELRALKAAHLAHLGAGPGRALATDERRKESTRLESAQVRIVDRARSKVVVRIGRRDFDVDFHDLVRFPQEGAWSLALLTRGRVEALVPVGDGWIPFRYVVVEVLAVAEQSLKVRSQAGSEWTVSFESAASSNGSGRHTSSFSTQPRRGTLLVARTSGLECLGVFRADNSVSRRAVLEFTQTLLQLQNSEPGAAADRAEDRR